VRVVSCRPATLAHLCHALRALHHGETGNSGGTTVAQWGRMTRTLRFAAFLALGVAVPAIAAPPPLYMRDLFTLSPLPPTASKPLTNAYGKIPLGQTAVVGQFLSEPVVQDVTALGALASLYLVSGRNGMPDCADVTVELFRKTSANERITVGAATVQDTIVPKRKLTEPMIVPILVEGQLAQAGDRMGATVIVTNRCTRNRNVILYYNAAVFPSGIVYTDLPPTTTTTTVTTSTTTTTTGGGGGGDGGGSTTTTTTGGGGSPTTTTIPAQPSCFIEPQTSYNYLRCQIDTMDAITRAQPWDDLKGKRMRKLMLVRLARARAWVDAASVRHDPRPALGRTLFQLTRFAHNTKIAVKIGRLAPPVGGELLSMQADTSLQASVMRDAAR
jgi:hypothetical protein